jgi:glutamyl-tRNA reductase
LNLSDEEIENLINQYDKEARAIKEETIRITWWMRGGINYDQAMALSLYEREIVNKIIKENMEATKQSGMPFF